MGKGKQFLMMLVALMVCLPVQADDFCVTTVTNTQYLRSLPSPRFKGGHAYPPLTRAAWPIQEFETLVHLTENWGYALEFGIASASDFDYVMTLPNERWAKMVALTQSNPKRYPLFVGFPQIQPNGFADICPPETWARNAAGEFLNYDGTTTTKGTAYSPAAPDAPWSEAGKRNAELFIKMKAYCPVAMILDADEYLLGAPATGIRAWSPDPRIIADKGDQSWHEYISAQVGRLGKLVSQPTRDATPDRLLYLTYQVGGGPGRNADPWNGWQWWTLGWEWIKGNTDIPSNEAYYNRGNSGYIIKGSNAWDILTMCLNAASREIMDGYPRSYNWLCAGWGWGGPDEWNSDIPHYLGFMKCYYTAGMIGAAAGFFRYPDGGFDAPFSSDQPPWWLPQMIALSYVHAQFTNVEEFVWQGDLLPGPNQHAMSKELPAFEFPTSEPLTVRVLARKHKTQAEWLVTAWAADGKDRITSVTIPELGALQLKARACGTVYRVHLEAGTPVVENVDNIMTISGTLQGDFSQTSPTVIAVDTTGTIINTVYADTSGAYYLWMPRDFSGSIIARSSKQFFFPVRRSFSQINTDFENWNFFAVDSITTISGTLRGDFSQTSPTVIAVDTTGTILNTVHPDASGAFSIIVPMDFTGSIIASSSKHVFLPARRAFRKINTEFDDQDFAAVECVQSLKDLTDDYSIIYKQNGRGKNLFDPATTAGPAVALTDDGGLILTAGDKGKDTLLITRSRAANKDKRTLKAIRSIFTSGTLSNLRLTGDVGSLFVGGDLAKLTVTEGSIGSMITTGSIGAIAMRGRSDIGTSDTATITSGTVMGNPQQSTSIIAEGSTGKRSSSITLNGVYLNRLSAGGQFFSSIKMTSKIGAGRNRRNVQMSGLAGGTAVVDLDVLGARSVSLRGASIMPGMPQGAVIQGAIQSLKGAGMKLNKSFKICDFNVSRFHSQAVKVSIYVTQGRISGYGFYLVDGGISKFAATAYSREPLTGFIGAPSALLISSTALGVDMLSDPGALFVVAGAAPGMGVDILNVSAPNGIYAKFYAGATTDGVTLTPSKSGMLPVIRTSLKVAPDSIANVYGSDGAPAKSAVRPPSASVKVYYNDELIWGKSASQP